jgi:predicted NBD/HSP70 family sugar kinase
MIPQEVRLIDGLVDRLSMENEPLDSQRRRLLLAAISEGGMTRKRLSEQFDIRAATVSRHVAELIEIGLVHELRRLGGKGQGRPEVVLSCTGGAILAIVIRALSDRLYGTLVDLGGNERQEIVRMLDASSVRPKGMHDLIAGIVRELRGKVPNALIAGAAISLPGIVDEVENRLLFSSRFPKAAPLTLTRLRQELSMDVVLRRALNAELSARLLHHPEERQSTTVLLHWGYGISLALADEGTIVSSGQRAFGEVGHWRSASAAGARCRCGATGCLEACAALWAIEDKLHTNVTTEDEFREILKTNPEVADHVLIRHATEAVAMALRDVYLLLFPRRIVISGPFVQSPTVRKGLEQSFRASLPSYMPADVKLEIASLSRHDEIVGAAKPLLHKALQARLDLCSTINPQ